MQSSRPNFITKKYSLYRKASADLLQVAHRKKMIHALIEVDISETRKSIREVRRRKSAFLSLTGYLVFCTARAVEKNRWMHAYRDFRNRLVAFEEVDISTTIERKIGGQYEVIPKIVRRANRKTCFEISEEIRHAKNESLEEAEVYRSIRKFLMLPTFLRRGVFSILDRFPKVMKRRAGTIMVTSVQMAGPGSAWGIPVASHTLNIAIGGITPKVVEREESFESREHLCLTISFNHKITDGAPASRFVRDLCQLIESEIHHTP
jgi:pyruvate/2-oxoglutarate dehydrogenase complex dihydrolipoamide acyltransferase (E2) component